MSISNGSESESDDDFEFQTILHVPKEGQQFDGTLKTSIEEFKERTTKSLPYQSTLSASDEQLLHQVNVAVMEALLCTLDNLGLNASKMDDEKLLCYINYVIKNVPYKVQAFAPKENCHS